MSGTGNRDGWDERKLSDDDSSPELSFDRGSRGFFPWALWALIPLGLGLLYLWLRGSNPEPRPKELPAASDSPAPAPAPPEEAEEAIDLPPLSESDEAVRDLASRLSSHPFLSSLLDIDDLARKLVVSVANVAEGASPARQLAHVRPEEGFTALPSSERTVIDPESYRRYDAPVSFFASLDAPAIGRLYRAIEPLLEEAHGELGLSERKGFRDTLSIALGVLLAVPIVEGPIPLRAVSVNYAFEDPALERLPAAQKHLVRMGPENTRRIQKKLEEIARALGVEPRLPG
ncbi:MAG: DUF3014 domain-containing protein [Vicinamibacteria bacterium]